MKKAIITGITGQDGAYLAELLLSKDYEVYGTYRKSLSENFWRIKELGIDNHPNLHLLEYDLRDFDTTVTMVKNIMPDEIYNLAAKSFVCASFEEPLVTTHVTGLGCVHLLEAIRLIDNKIRFYQASTSEMFGQVLSHPQDENTRFFPRNPYGIAKLYAHWMVVNYRDMYGLFACSGILYNHESPLRGINFVTRKITDSVAKIKLGEMECLELGNMDAKRDWGYAKDYVEGMYLMLQANKADNYVLATNKTHTVREFVTMAFKSAGIELEFRGKNEQEVAVDVATGKVIVKVNLAFYRPPEKDILVGNPQKAKDELGWEAKCSLEELCSMMVKADLKRNENSNNS
ncbi:MAG: GDP-mannose 4,6-dehydratase [Campylobacterales bacterium]